MIRYVVDVQEMDGASFGPALNECYLTSCWSTSTAYQKAPFQCKAFPMDKGKMWHHYTGLQTTL